MKMADPAGGWHTASLCRHKAARSCRTYPPHSNLAHLAPESSSFPGGHPAIPPPPASEGRAQRGPSRGLAGPGENRKKREPGEA